MGLNETLLGAFPCALQFMHGLRHGVLYVSTAHLCFETTHLAAANTKVPMSRVLHAERARDPVFHLIPNAMRLHLEDGASLHFASFHSRDDAYALLTRCLKTQTHLVP